MVVPRAKRDDAAADIEAVTAPAYNRVVAVRSATKYEVVIGVEVHAELRTASKMFCACPTRPPEGQPDLPNSRVCPICLGMPGTLPVINRRAVELVMLTGLALNCSVETAAVRFERKNYFYPDLPKGYQISQYALPLCRDGRLDVSVPAEEATVRLGITRAHLEEDTARMSHAGRGYSVVDFNRAGVPLMEIVTEPDLRSPAQARAYAEALRDILRYIGASDADMEAGQLRIEGNISLRPVGAPELGTKVEVKNLNSFRSVERALGYEAERQAELLERGAAVVLETRGWDENAGRTVSQRVKEEADDYRYFPEPDLPPLRPSPAWVERLRSTLPELPEARRRRYTDELGLSAYDAGVLTADAALARYFDEVVATGVAPKPAANWMTGEFSRLLNRRAADGLRADRVPLAPAALAELVEEVEAGRVSATSAKEVLTRVFESGESPRDVIEREGLGQVSDEGLIARTIDGVIADHPAQVAAFRAGNQKLFGFLVGQVMKRTSGRADARLVNAELRRRLG